MQQVGENVCSFSLERFAMKLIINWSTESCVVSLKQLYQKRDRSGTGVFLLILRNL